MLTDRQKIEDCIIPVLLYGTLLTHIQEKGEIWGDYSAAAQIINSFVYSRVKGDRKLLRRLDRAVQKISMYFVEHKFTTQTSFLVISEWSRALLEGGAILLEGGVLELLQGMEATIIEHGYALEGFDKIDAEAIDHIPHIHSIANIEGYFQ